MRSNGRGFQAKKLSQKGKRRTPNAERPIGGIAESDFDIGRSAFSPAFPPCSPRSQTEFGNEEISDFRLRFAFSRKLTGSAGLIVHAARVAGGSIDSLASRLAPAT